MTKLLKGICWDHSRGYVPLVAAAQRFHELHPECDIAWEKRSLRSFGETGLKDLCQRYDLLVVDHPFCGEAASTGCLAPLDQQLDSAFLQECQANAVGPSYQSYRIGGHLWALPVDAACPVAVYRPDIMADARLAPPRDWSELLRLAKTGRVAFPAIDTDAILHLFALALACDGSLFTSEAQPSVASAEALRFALQRLKELRELCDERCLASNPIAVLDWLAQSDYVAYCPFAFGYSNYSRAGYASKPLQACAPPELNGRPLRTVLGGAGLALSAFSSQPEAGRAFATFCMSEQTQRGLYAYAGGQPGDRRAWKDEALNQHTRSFFADTLPTIESSYLRPRYAGFVAFQRASGLAVCRFLKSEASLLETLETINDAYRQSNPNKAENGKVDTH